MSDITDYEEVVDSFKQWEIAISASKRFVGLYRAVKNFDNKVDGYIAGTEFDNIPIDLKQTLQSFRQEYKSFLSSVEANGQLMAFINYITNLPE